MSKVIEFSAKIVIEFSDIKPIKIAPLTGADGCAGF